MRTVKLLDALEDDPELEQPTMRFVLTYSGPLKSSQGDPNPNQTDRLAGHKQAIRKQFHKQLKKLWATNKFLREHEVYDDFSPVNPAEHAQRGAMWGNDKPKIPMAEAIANNYRENGYRFVPLVRESLSLLCALDIQFLRNDYPGGIVWAGDLDNRIKTLIDTLRRPKSGNELRGNETPTIDEDPFFCLLEDDKLVTALTVRTDTLLSPDIGADKCSDKDDEARRVLAIINVEIKPYDVDMFNLSFA
jgi:hypothetical protein